MPLVATQSKTPAGRLCLTMRSSGEVSAADAEALMKTMAPGSQNASLPILAVVEDGAKFSPEARQIFTRMNGEPGQKQLPVAIVVNNAPLRVMLGFVIRLTSAANSTRFFGKQEEAFAWLDEKLAQG